MTLATTLDEVSDDLEEALRLMREALDAMPGAAATLRTAVSNLRFTPQFIKDNTNADISRAENELTTNGEKFVTFCECEKDLVQDCRDLLEVADAYDRVSFDDLFTKLDELLQKPDWESPASTLYQTRLQMIDPRARSMEEAVISLREVFRDLKSTMNGYWLSVVLLLAGMIVGLVGVVAALATAGPTIGIGTIVGIVASVLGLLITLAGVFTIPRVSDEVEAHAEQINRLVATLRDGNDWGMQTSSSDWDWSEK